MNKYQKFRLEQELKNAERIRLYYKGYEYLLYRVNAYQVAQYWIAYYKEMEIQDATDKLLARASPRNRFEPVMSLLGKLIAVSSVYRVAKMASFSRAMML